METLQQDKDKKKKLPIWARLVIYITLLFLVGLAIAWILNKLGIIPKLWSDILSTIFSSILALLGVFFDKDVRLLIFQRFLSNSSSDPKSSRDTSPSTESPVSITVSPSLTVSPSQNASSQLSPIETSTPNSGMNATQPVNSSTGRQDGKTGTDDEQKETQDQIPNRTKQAPVIIMPLTNPDSIFLFNTRLPHPKEFFGRKRERESLKSRTRIGSSTSIVGTRRIGKSWLIEYLRLVAKNQLGSRFRVGCLDATAPSCATVAGFTAKALEELGTLSSNAENTNLSLAMLERFVNDLRLKDQTPVLCIDEFEGFNNRQIFDLNFFTGLRAMTQGGLVLVVASKKPLINIVGSYGDTSGFFNVFEQITLKPFTREEAEEFVRAKGDQSAFTESEKVWILGCGLRGEQQWSPLRLQLAGKLLLDDKIHQYYHPDDPIYWERFTEELEEKYRGVLP